MVRITLTVFSFERYLKKQPSKFILHFLRNLLTYSIKYHLFIVNIYNHFAHVIILSQFVHYYSYRRYFPKFRYTSKIINFGLLELCLTWNWYRNYSGMEWYHPYIATDLVRCHTVQLIKYWIAWIALNCKGTLVVVVGLCDSNTTPC